MEFQSVKERSNRDSTSYMNILFGKAQLVNLDNNCIHYETLYVKGRNIRFIHIPKKLASFLTLCMNLWFRKFEQLSVRETILNYLKKSKVIHRAEKSTATYLRRQKKLQKYQEETRNEINKLKLSQK